MTLVSFCPEKTGKSFAFLFCCETQLVFPTLMDYCSRTTWTPLGRDTIWKLEYLYHIDLSATDICTTMHFLKLRNKHVWLSLPFLKVGCIQGDPTRLSQVICFWWGQKFQKTFRTEKSKNKVTALRVNPQSMIPKTVKISLWSEKTQIFDNVYCRQQTANHLG